MLFLDNVRIKRLQIIYNYKKLFLKIRRYVVEYILNLDTILANLKRVNIIITKAKSRFSYFNIKIL